MLKRLELDFDSHKVLLEYCGKRGIEFLLTPFDVANVEMVAELNLPLFKIASGEITNLPLLRAIGSYRKPIVLSTGMSKLEEIETAIQIIEKAGTGREEITALHCNTAYPTPMSDVNLRAMVTMRENLGVKVGYSDHTVGTEISIAAVALGATVIEKHFTLDRSLPGPDHGSSVEPLELKKMITGIRNTEKALGTGIKIASESERQNIEAARKSIVASRHIDKDERFTKENLTCKRPGIGTSPMLWDDVLEGYASREYEVNEMVEL